jgi:DNA-binding transcriptional LysR family regulator
MHDIDDFDLNLLGVLDALLLTGSVSAAAKALGLTQSTVSHSLSRLRIAFRDPLLVRVGRGMVRTPRAVALAPAVEKVLADVRRVLEHDVGFDPARASRTFTLACPDLFVPFVPEVLGELAKSAPHVRLAVVPPPPDLAESLGIGAIDLALVNARDEGSGLVQQIVGQVSWAILARRKHPCGKELDLATWLAYPHVVVRAGQGPGLVERALAARGKERRVAFVAPSFLAAPHAVAHTDWFFAAPRELAADLAKDLGLLLLEPPIPLPALKVALVWHERLAADAGHKWLRELLRGAAQRRLRPHRGKSALR